MKKSLADNPRISAQEIICLRFVVTFPFLNLLFWTDRHLFVLLFWEQLVLCFKLQFCFKKLTNFQITAMSCNINEEMLSNLKLSTNFDDFVITVLKYNSDCHSIRDLGVLREFLHRNQAMESFISVTLPVIIMHASFFQEYFPSGIKIHSRGQSQSIAFTSNEVACILCNMFLTTITDRWDFSPAEDPVLAPASFMKLFRSPEENEDINPRMAKLGMLYFGYFNRLEDLLAIEDGRNIIVTRNSLQPIPDVDFWFQSTNPILPVQHAVGGAMLKEEEQVVFKKRLCKVISANSFVGGHPSGVTGKGMRSEPATFALCPEALVALLVSERMEADEAIYIEGVGLLRTFARVIVKTNLGR